MINSQQFSLINTDYCVVCRDRFHGQYARKCCDMWQGFLVGGTILSKVRGYEFQRTKKLELRCSCDRNGPVTFGTGTGRKRQRIGRKRGISSNIVGSRRGRSRRIRRGRGIMRGRGRGVRASEVNKRRLRTQVQSVWS